ncbi:uncharacterized protein LOC119769029 [Culex quinquefasciatus]|uniref:uncharacterized protein LOC119769029 n=1 Tax=Culex quinquefasciatus TaxID=7176 RepID=UPI0018E302F4|nr:uncharacterized protein LOC119769029 [Culex quinquefasciatus]
MQEDLELVLDYLPWQNNLLALNIALPMLNELADMHTGRIPSARIETAAWHIPSDVFLADPTFSEPHEIDLVMASNYLLRTDRVKLANGTVTLQQEVEEHFHGTHARDDSGRFLLQLPFKDAVLELGDNRVQALRRFNRLKRRPSCNPELREQYTELVKENEALGHCKEIDEREDPPEVLRPQSGDSEAGKYSLIDVLKVGPTVQNDLFSIILRFRRHPVASTADVEEEPERALASV